MTDSEPSADLLLARRVLDGLVRGTEVREDLLNGGFVQWAVSVLHLPSGPSVSIASSVGGGAYLPPGVFIPNSVACRQKDGAGGSGEDTQVAGRVACSSPRCGAVRRATT